MNKKIITTIFGEMKMKIFLGTLNGGGDKTLTRLYNSIKNFVIPQLHGYEWVWSVLSQGSKGANEQVLKNIKFRR